jgi:hypothetical protein
MRPCVATCDHFSTTSFPALNSNSGLVSGLKVLSAALPNPNHLDAVLVRLALGAMLAERGQAVPIILDDALVYSDDDRITRMFDALSRAGQQQQIIVLTCRTRAFEQLGGRSIKIDPAVAGRALGSRDLDGVWQNESLARYPLRE